MLRKLTTMEVELLAEALLDVMHCVEYVDDSLQCYFVLQSFAKWRRQKVSPVR